LSSNFENSDTTAIALIVMTLKVYRAHSPEAAENRASAASLAYPASEFGENAWEGAGE
jgi:hypothetical protein